MKKALLLVVVLAIGTVALLRLKTAQENAGETVRSHLEYNYTYDKRDVFNDDASADLAEVDKMIGELSEKAAAASAAVKADAQAKIQKLIDERAALGKKLEALKNARETNWNDLKTDYQKTEQEMETSLNAAWQWLDDQTRS